MRAKKFTQKELALRRKALETITALRHLRGDKIINEELYEKLKLKVVEKHGKYLSPLRQSTE